MLVCEKNVHKKLILWNDTLEVENIYTLGNVTNTHKFGPLNLIIIHPNHSSPFLKNELIFVIFLCLGIKGYISCFIIIPKCPSFLFAPKRMENSFFLKTFFGWPILIFHYSFISTHMHAFHLPPKFYSKWNQHLKTRKSQ